MADTPKINSYFQFNRKKMSQVQVHLFNVEEIFFCCFMVALQKKKLKWVTVT